MIHTLRQFSRMLKISAILSRYELDEFLEATHLYRPMRLLRVITPWGRPDMTDKRRGERLRLALTRWARSTSSLARSPQHDAI